MAIAAIGFTALSVFTDPFNMGLLITIIAITATLVTIVIFRKRHPNASGWLSALWSSPIWLVFPLIAIATGGTCKFYIEHKQQIEERLMPIEDARPWQEGLTARVHWNKQPSDEIRKGFSDTFRLLGFNYVVVESIKEANLRIWLNSWEYHCKWPATEGFASLDPSPGNLGSQVGDIHICKITTPYTWDRLPGYSLMAHETAHLLAAQEHIGNGLMAEGGGDGSRWFNDTEIQTMCDNIDSFHQSVRSAPSVPNDWFHQTDGEDASAQQPCGTGGLRPQQAPSPKN